MSAAATDTEPVLSDVQKAENQLADSKAKAVKAKAKADQEEQLEASRDAAELEAKRREVANLSRDLNTLLDDKQSEFLIQLAVTGSPQEAWKRSVHTLNVPGRHGGQAKDIDAIMSSDLFKAAHRRLVRRMRKASLLPAADPWTLNDLLDDLRGDIDLARQEGDFTGAAGLYRLGSELIKESF